MTANAGAADPAKKVQTVQTIPNDLIDPIFAAVVEAVDEAVINALVNNRAMTGRDGHHVDALPRKRLQEVLRKYNRLAR